MDYFLHELWISRFALAEGFLRTIEISVLSITLGTAGGPRDRRRADLRAACRCGCSPVSMSM